MRINNCYDSSALNPQRDAGGAVAGTDFGAILTKVSQTFSDTGITNGTPQTVEVVKTDAEINKAAAQREYEKALAEFRDYMKKSPIQHMRDAILKKMGLTEEELAALPPEKHDAIELEIGRRIKEQLLGREEGAADDAALAAFGHGAGAEGSKGAGRLLIGPGSDVLAQQLAAVLAASAPEAGGDA